MDQNEISNLIDTPEPTRNLSATGETQRRISANPSTAPSVHLRRHFVALARKIKLWAGPCGRPVKIGVTSMERGAGKSTVAFNLAATLTRIENDRVLLAEADFGKHFLTRRLGHGGASGLSEIIGLGANPASCIFPTTVENLSVLGSGYISEQESVEMQFDRLGSILDKNFLEFGYVVFDLPIANDLTSCYSLLPFMDGVVLVVDAGKIDRKQVRRTKQNITSCGVELIGLVLNQSN